MRRNIEIKARVEELESVRARVEKMADEGPSTLHQEDTFFNSPGGRLKLRLSPGRPAELIYYERSDASTPSESRYLIYEAPDGEVLRGILGTALGDRAVVKKRRTLFMVGQTRVHLDEVEHLGAFVELEVVLRDDQSSEDGEEVASSLMQNLGITADQLVAEAYVDLLQRVSRV
jgi:predicted adenylyl cyclase CyaB